MEEVKEHCKKVKKIHHIYYQAKLHSYFTAPRYKYGYKLPKNRDYDHAKEIDRK